MAKNFLILIRFYLLDLILFLIDIDFYIQFKYYNNFEYAKNYANFCYQLRKYKKSILIYKKILEKIPLDACIIIKLANTELKLGNVIDSLQNYEKALLINPNSTDAHINYGKALYRLGRSDQAFDHLSKIFKSDLVDYEVFEMLHICGAYNSNLSFILQNSINIQSELVKSRRINLTNTNKNIKSLKDKQNLAIHCSFFNSKGVQIFFLPILNEIDKDFFNIVLFGNGISAELHKQYECVNLRSVSDEDFIQLVSDYSIDILIDIDGMGSRITRVGRVSPIQICYFNYPCTTGSDYMDYFLADRVSIPEESEKYFSEKILILNTSVMSFKYQESWPRIKISPCFNNGYITFGFFGNPEKFNHLLIESWGKILKNVFNSKLLLVHPLFKSKQIIDYFKNMFNEFGCSSDNIIFVNGKTHNEVLAYYNKIDIALDPFPYNGGHTTMECINLGVPIISYVGSSYPGRHGIDFFAFLPRTDLLVYSKDEYVEKNIYLANNPLLLNELRKELPIIAQSSKLTNSKFAGSEWNKVLKNIAK